jgi:hypothetical protein
MADLIFIGITIAFFTAAALVVVGCERIIGPDPVVAEERRVEPTETDVVT